MATEVAQISFRQWYQNFGLATFWGRNNLSMMTWLSTMW